MDYLLDDAKIVHQSGELFVDFRRNLHIFCRLMMDALDIHLNVRILIEVRRLFRCIFKRKDTDHFVLLDALAFKEPLQTL